MSQPKFSITPPLNCAKASLLTPEIQDVVVQITSSLEPHHALYLSTINRIASARSYTTPIQIMQELKRNGDSVYTIACIASLNLPSLSQVLAATSPHLHDSIRMALYHALYAPPTQTCPLELTPAIQTLKSYNILTDTSRIYPLFVHDYYKSQFYATFYSSRLPIPATLIQTLTSFSASKLRSILAPSLQDIYEAASHSHATPSLLSSVTHQFIQSLQTVLSLYVPLNHDSGIKTSPSSISIFLNHTLLHTFRLSLNVAHDAILHSTSTVADPVLYSESTSVRFIVGSCDFRDDGITVVFDSGFEGAVVHMNKSQSHVQFKL